MKKILSLMAIVGFMLAIGTSCGSMNRHGMAKSKKHVKIVKKYKKGCGCTGKRK